MTSPELENDKRLRAAHRIFERHRSGILKVFKTVRAGATTSLVIESYLRKEKCVISVSTHEEADETILSTVRWLCNQYGKKQPRIVKVQSNQRCSYNIAYLNSLPYGYKREQYTQLLVKPRREGCGDECPHYHTCEVTDIIRNGSDADIIVILHDKLSNLLHPVDYADEGMNSLIVDRLLECKNINIDESHKIEQSESDGMVAKKSEQENNKWQKVENKVIKGKYIPIIKERNPENPKKLKYPELANVIKYLAKILFDTEVQATIDRAEAEAKADDYYLKHIKHEITRPLELQKLDIIRKNNLIIYPALVAECHEMIKNDDFLRFGISASEMMQILTYANVINARQLQATISREELQVEVRLSDSRIHKLTLIGDFLQQAAEDKSRRIMFTTATFSSFDYKQFFNRGTEIKDVTFGRRGDPMNTVAMHRIYNYHMPLSSNSFWKNSIKNNLPEIMEILETAIDLFGLQNLFICTMNKRNAGLIQDALKDAGYNIEVHYYQGSRTQGVTCTQRIGIFVGGGYIPVYARAGSTESYEEAYRKARETFFCNTWQAIERVKDPDAKVLSAAITLMPIEDTIAMNMFINRFDVKTNKSLIRMPTIMSLGIDDVYSGLINVRNFLTSGAEGSTSTNDKNSPTNILENLESGEKQSNSKNGKLLGKRNIGFYNVLYKIQVHFDKNCENTAQVDEREKRESSVHLAKISRPIVDLAITDNCDDTGFTGSKWKRHKEGREPLYTEIILKDNTVRFINFSNLTANGVKKIAKYMKINDLWGVVTQDKAGVYGIWLFAEPVKATIAKSIAKSIMIGAGVKCDYQPKYSSRRRSMEHGENEIRLPMYHGELVARSCEFTDNIEGMEITINDFSKSGSGVEEK